MDRRAARAWSLAAFLSAVPLVLFGGSVTTLGAGMAVEGWLVAEGHFLLFFPVEKWFRDTATFVEHTHRLFGMLVGLFAVLAVASNLRRPRERGMLPAALVALAAVCIQGTLGGFRVLANDPELAFLHGVCAQVVLAILGANALVQSGRLERTMQALPARASTGVRGASLAWGATGVVFLQIVLGARYRHALRADGTVLGHVFLAHMLVAVFVFAAVILASERLRRALRASTAELPAAARRLPGRMQALLGLQVALGVLAWMGYRPNSVGPLEIVFSIAHVLGGGLLLTLCLQAVLWTRVLPPAESAATGEAGVTAGEAEMTGEARAEGTA